MNKHHEFVNIPGPVGVLEGIVHNVPESASISHIGIICHPHPLHQGTMQNKVVTTIVKTFLAMGMPCVRFNFRGVGKSAGIFANAIGETEDCLAVIDWAKNRWLDVHIWLAGFSFGSYVATLASLQRNIFQLINIAPPVHNNDFHKLLITSPCLVIQGDNDEIVPAPLVHQWYETLATNKTLIKMANTTHFFHGKLIELHENIKQHYGF